MTIYLVVERPDGSNTRAQLRNGFTYRANPGEKLLLIDESGNPVDLPLSQDGSNLILNLAQNELAIIEDFFVATGQVADQEPLVQDEPVNVNLSGGEVDTGTADSLGAATQPDDAFSLMRFSETEYIGFENGLQGVDSSLFGNGFEGGIPDDKPPVALADFSTEANEDNPVILNLLTNDRDPEGGPIRLTAIEGTGVSSGQTVTLPSGGEITFLGGGEVQYTPGDAYEWVAEGETATDTFTYTIADQAGNTASATVTVSIEGANDSPVAVDDAGTGDEDSIISINVLENDSDPDLSNTLTVTDVSDPSKGTVLFTPGGDITFDPGDDFQHLSDGETATVIVEYTISDNDGATSSANITFVVTGINDNPVAVDDPLTIDEDTSITVDLVSNDSDAESDPLSVIEINGDPVATGIPVTLPSGGKVTLQADGTVSYDPDGQFEDLGAGDLATDIFTYTVDDGNGGSDIATVTVDINGVNDGPTIENNTLTLEEGETIPVTSTEIFASDPDHGPTELTFTVSNSVGGQFLLNGVASTTFTQQDVNDGLVTYQDDGTETPPAYDLTVTDPGNLSDQSPLVLHYTPVNDAPDAVDDSDSTNEDSAVDVDLTGNDTDAENDPVTVSKLDGNFAGVGVPVSLASGATVMSLGNGEVRYNPNQSFEGLIDGQTAIDTFTYEINDGNGATDVATVTMTINGVNDGPTIESNTLTLSEGDTIPVTTSEINATDPDHGSADLTFSVTNPVGGQFLLNGAPSVSFTLKDIEDGLVQYQDDGTETPPSYDLTVTDPGNLSDQSPLDLYYTPVNDAPEATDDSATTDQNTVENIDILTNDTDPENQSLSVSGVNQQPVAVGIPTVIASGATVTLQPNGTFNYDPNGQFDNLSSTETAVDTFTYLASDGNGGTDISTVSVTVNGLNDTPDALNDGFNVDENGTVNYDLRTNDTDPDGDDLTVAQINGATIGSEGSLTLPSGAVVTLNVDGTVNYNPNDQFELSVGQTAIDTFTYQVSDGNGGYATASATVTIDGTNDAPVANEDFSLGNTPGRPVVFNVAANDTDIDGTINPATVDLDPSSPGITTTLTVNGEGTWESNGLGQVIFTPDENLLGNPTPLTYSIQDNDGLTASSNGSLTVTYANFDLWFGNDLSGSVSTSEFEQSRVLISGMADLLPFDESNGAKAGLFSWSASGDGALNQGITADDDLFVNSALTYSRPFSGGTNIDYAINYGVQQILASLEPGGGGRDYADQILLILTDASPSDQIIAPQAQIIAAADAAKALGIQIGFIAIQEAQSSQAALDVLAQAASPDASGQPILMTAPTYAGIDQAQIINAIAGLAPEHAYNIVNQPILAIGDAEIVAENGTVDINPLDNDNHVSNDTLTITEINTVPITPGNSVTLSSGAVVSMNVDGSLTYDPNGQFDSLDNGDAQADMFEYTVIDESGNSETGTIGVTVEGVSAVPPIVIDMDGDGAEFDGIEEGISIDVDGDGVAEQTAWASEDDAVLIFDENSNNAVDGPGEFAFSTYASDPGATDLEGLAHFDSDGDGTLDADDENFAKFKVWQDSNGDGEASESEMTSLLEAGIESISLTSDQNSYTSADGDVLVHGEAQIVYQDGSTGIAADAEFAFEEIIDSDESGFEVLTESGTSINVQDSLPPIGTIAPEGDIVAPPCLAVDDHDLL